MTSVAVVAVPAWQGAYDKRLSRRTWVGVHYLVVTGGHMDDQRLLAGLGVDDAQAAQLPRDQRLQRGQAAALLSDDLPQDLLHAAVDGDLQGWERGQPQMGCVHR